MKVKDLERTANIAFSPKDHQEILLAAGTAAQQLDASFNTNSALEIYSLNLSQPNQELNLKASVGSEHRFHKLIWGSHASSQNGIIVSGCDAGLIQVYNGTKLLQSNKDGLVLKQEKHTGPVQALDFNPFQSNLFASGAGDSEIFIWDLNNMSSPMSPGVKTQPAEDVVSVAWNRQVQHILASSFASKCVIWDLRKNEPIIKLADTASRVHYKVVAWHPEVATQLCLGSEEDHSPVIQLWDLRFATSPLKSLENHQRGILALSWCQQDPDLLISCGKDNRILCWNPNSAHPNGEVLSEIAKTNQWSFDVAWCPKNPLLIASPNYDGHVSVYSIMGGSSQQPVSTTKLADSFPGMTYAEAPLTQQKEVTYDPIKPPKWLKKPIRAKFGFGGKLVSFEKESKKVYISQVITEPELVRDSEQLEKALESGDFRNYCLSKLDVVKEDKKEIWKFLNAMFGDNCRSELLDLLGYKIEDINNKLMSYVGDSFVDKFNNLNRLDELPDQLPKKTESFKIKTGDDSEGLITKALLMNNVEVAVELCLQAKRFADALIIATTGGPELLAKTQHKYLEESGGYLSHLISALISEDWASVIENCDISNWKEALAASLTHSSEEDLLFLSDQLGKRLEEESRNNSKLSEYAQLCYICSGNFDKLVESWSGNALKSSKDLQELIELVSFLQRAIERQGRRVQVSGSLAKVLSHYASILASQGHLSTALSYLGQSTDQEVAALRDRLAISLGQKVGQDLRQQQRRGSQRQSFSNYPSSFTPTPQPQFQNFNTGLPNAVASVGQPWQQPVTNNVPVQPQQPPRIFSPGPSPVPAQPARPPSGGGLPRKYVLDPSVTSNPYGGYNRNLPQSQNGFGTFSPAMPVPSPSLNPVPLVPGFTPAPPVDPPQPAYTSTAPPGWNDPPIINKPKPVKPEVAPMADPITHPIFGAAPDNYEYQGQGYQYQKSFPPPPPTSMFTPGNSNVGVINPGSFNNNPMGGPGVPPPVQPAQFAREETPAPIEKAPIPEEHVHMQTVFDELKNQCSLAANNPQTRRKLEDVGRKLEVLYDMLREHRLSQNTLNSLHQMVQLVQNGDYMGGLGLHTQLVSGADFAQIASFMPGIKVLLQCALQLQVYLR